jgi:hypothetical protein
MSCAPEQLVTTGSFAETNIKAQLPHRIRTGRPDPKADVLILGID